MTEIVLAHCWTGAPDQAWYPALRNDMEAAGWTVRIPALPDSDAPSADAWRATFAQSVGTPHENLVLVGHSLGCMSVLRYLESLPVSQRIAGVVLVAAFSRPLGIAAIDPFHSPNLDWAALKARPEPKAVILGADDPYLRERLAAETEHFTGQLGADVLILARGGHFSPASGCVALPQVQQFARQFIKMRESANGTY